MMERDNKRRIPRVLLHLVFCLVIAAVNPSFAAVITIELGNPNDINPDPYIVEIEQLEIYDHSAVDFYVQNIEDPTRYKDWVVTVYIPQGYQPLTQLDFISYDAPNLPLYIEEPNVPMSSIDSIIPGYDAYRATTYDEQWYEYGTQPVGTEWGRVPIGNPEWIGYHFYVDDAVSETIFVSIYDECVIPEPATIFLLGLGGLLLNRKRRA